MYIPLDKTDEDEDVKTASPSADCIHCIVCTKNVCLVCMLTRDKNETDGPV